MDAKILISLKYLAYGCSVNAFRDYFQIGESTALLSVKKFTSCIANSIFQKKFFSFFTALDAKKVEALHYAKYGIHGLLGSLDCSHFVWGNCPVAHHGQYQGKEGRPTIVVEALADYNLYVWHAVFGYSGTLAIATAAPDVVPVLLSLSFAVTFAMISSSSALRFEALFPRGRDSFFASPFHSRLSLPLVASQGDSSSPCFFFLSRTTGLACKALLIERNLGRSFKYSHEGL